MRKVFFLTAFFLSISMIGYSQVTVINSTGESINVNVQYLGGDCVPGTSDLEVTIAPGGNNLFNLETEVYRVGASGTPGSGFSTRCEECAGSMPGPYIFIWAADCSWVRIMGT